MQNFTKYITEVKLRSFYLMISFFILFLTCYCFQIELLYILLRSFLNLNHRFISTNVTEILTSIIYLCFLISCLFLIPNILYQWWCFQKPSKYRWETNTTLFLFLSSLFLTELSWIYFWIIPKLSAFFTSYQIVIYKDVINSSHIIKNNISNIVEISPKLDTIINYNLYFYIFIFCILQIPLIFTICYQYQLIHCTQLSESRKILFFFIILISAFLSPPDLFNQLFCTIFLSCMIEFCILIGYFIETINKYK